MADLKIFLAKKMQVFLQIVTLYQKKIKKGNSISRVTELGINQCIQTNPNSEAGFELVEHPSYPPDLSPSFQN